MSNIHNNLYKHFLAFLLIAFFCYSYILKTLPLVLTSYMTEKYHVTISDLGILNAIYYWIYALGQIPLAILFTRVNTKIILTVFVSFATIGILPLIYSDSWYMVIVGRVFVAISYAAATPALLIILEKLYKDKFSIVLGIAVSIGILSSVYSNSLICYFQPFIGVVGCIKILLYFSIILSITVYLFCKNIVQANSSNTDLDSKSTKMGCNLVSILLPLISPKFLLICFFAGVMIGPIEGLADGPWTSILISKTYNLSIADANSLTLSIFLGMVIGSYILPYLSNKTDRPYLIVSLFGLLMSVSIMVFLLRIDFAIVKILLPIIGIGGAYQVLVISEIVPRLSKNHRTGIAPVAVNVAMTLSGSFFHISIPFIMQYIKNSAFVLSESEYCIIGISIIPICCLIAAIGFMVMGIMQWRQDKRNI